jgi:hypothetical protein
MELPEMSVKRTLKSGCKVMHVNNTSSTWCSVTATFKPLGKWGSENKWQRRRKQDTSHIMALQLLTLCLTAWVRESTLARKIHNVVRSQKQAIIKNCFSKLVCCAWENKVNSSVLWMHRSKYAGLSTFSILCHLQVIKPGDWYSTVDTLINSFNCSDTSRSLILSARYSLFNYQDLVNNYIKLASCLIILTVLCQTMVYVASTLNSLLSLWQKFWHSLLILS